VNSQAEDELYIVMELLESDLHRIIQSKQVSLWVKLLSWATTSSSGNR